MQFSPAPMLQPFVKSYTVVKIERDLVDEVFYPSGYLDLAIKISDGKAATDINGHLRNMPDTEILGQLTVPTRLTVAKDTTVLIARLHPHANSLFFSNPIAEFTNYAVDLQAVFARECREFHDSLIHERTDEKKIHALDTFLLQKLRKNEKIYRKTKIIEQVSHSIANDLDSFDIKHTAEKFGFSTRYIEKLFLQIVGVTPQSFFNLQRFNKSIGLVLTSNLSLTTVAYQCGYYDQAHFIKEFKKFTGITPSEARPALSEGGAKFQEAVNIGL